MNASTHEPGDLEFRSPGDLDASRSEERAKQVLKGMRQVAVWGASDNELRKSFRVIRFLDEHEITAVPLGAASFISGLPAVNRLETIDPPPDVVAVFCNPSAMAEVGRKLARTRVPAVWFQEGLIDTSTARMLEEAEKIVVMDRCIMRDFRREVLGEEVESWFPV